MPNNVLSLCYEPKMNFDYGMLPPGNDLDVYKLARYFLNNKVICVYIEHGYTRVHTCFMTPSKVLIEGLDDEP